MYTFEKLISAIQEDNEDFALEILSHLTNFQLRRGRHGYLLPKRAYVNTGAPKDIKFFSSIALTEEIISRSSRLFRVTLQSQNMNILSGILHLLDMLQPIHHKHLIDEDMMDFIVMHSNESFFLWLVNTEMFDLDIKKEYAICRALSHNKSSKLDVLLKCWPNDITISNFKLKSIFRELINPQLSIDESLDVLLSDKVGRNIIIDALKHYGFMTDETYERFIKKMYEHPKGVRFLAENFVQILSVADSENKRNLAANLHVQLIRDIDRLEDDTSICLGDYHCLFKEDNLWALNRLFQEHGLELMYEYNFGGIEDVRAAIHMGCPLILEYLLTLPGYGEKHLCEFTNALSTSDSSNEYLSMLDLALKANHQESRMHSVLVCLAVYIPEFKERLSHVYPDLYASITQSLSLVELGYCLARKGISKNIACNIGQYVNINAPSSTILHGYYKASLDRAELRRQIILEQENCYPIGLFEQVRNMISNYLFQQAEEIFDDEEDIEFSEEHQAIKKRRCK